MDMFILEKYYNYYLYFSNNFLISKTNVISNFDSKINYICLKFDYYLKNKKNWLLNILFLIFLLTNKKITYKKNFFWFLKKNKKLKILNLTILLKKKWLFLFIENLIFLLFSTNNEMQILYVNKYLKKKSFNIFKFLKISNLLTFPFFKNIFKNEKEYFYMRNYFKCYLDIVFKNNNNFDNFYSNIHLLKLLKFPLTKKLKKKIKLAG